MASERVEFLGTRAELRARKQEIIREIGDIGTKIRLFLNPAKDAAELPGDKILDAAIALNEYIIQVREIDEKINKLNEVLGV